MSDQMGSGTGGSGGSGGMDSNDKLLAALSYPIPVIGIVILLSDTICPTLSVNAVFPSSKIGSATLAPRLNPPPNNLPAPLITGGISAPIAVVTPGFNDSPPLAPSKRFSPTS